ncbi:MAG: 50S ribosomal protein L10 [Chloroflexi bacterium]|nr:50S ribosomal protein L10 [Chloroflexota bacterium]
MPSQRNIEAVEGLRQKLSRCTVVIATGFAGMTVATMTEMRRKLREKGLEYQVVKNTLTHIAAREAGKAALKDIMEGQTGLVFGYADPVEVAKAVQEYVRTTRSPLVVRGGVMDGRGLTAAEVAALASLPPRPELMARLAGQLKGSLAALVFSLNSPMRGLVTVLQRSVEKAQGTAAPSDQAATGV